MYISRAANAEANSLRSSASYGQTVGLVLYLQVEVNWIYGMLLPMFARTTKAVILKLVELRLEKVNQAIYSHLSFLGVKLKV